MMYKLGIGIVCLAFLLLGINYFIPNTLDSYKQLLTEKSTQVTTSNLANPVEFASWREFIPQSGLFQVKLPQPPQYAKDFLPIPSSDQKRRYDIYASEKIDGTLFLISVITYPEEAELSFADDMLQQTVEELLHSKPDNKLTKISDTIFQKIPGRDFSIDNREFHVEGKVIMVNKTLYVLSYITRKGDFNAKEYQYFIDSFELLHREAKPSA